MVIEVSWSSRLEKFKSGVFFEFLFKKTLSAEKSHAGRDMKRQRHESQARISIFAEFGGKSDFGFLSRTTWEFPLVPPGSSLSCHLRVPFCTTCKLLVFVENFGSISWISTLEPGWLVEVWARVVSQSDKENVFWEESDGL